MKGPGIRYDIDIRRVWECPACGNRMKFLGDTTASRCSCDAHEWMRLIIERTDREFPIREQIVIPEEEPVEAEVKPVEETPESAVITEIPPPETVSESAAPEVAPTEAEIVSENVADTDQSPDKSEQPKPLPAKPQPPKPTSSSSEEDNAFGENVFDD
ncbi:MAG: hypothetical protein P8M30_20080 [Planctomycetaceae bacterium]|jgi:hypothetical protein|nr:hypothetical protein [Planctomycetaceae bacterium]MDG2391612.1 hypothetical protein [Planctomycetaceae bacterium]